MLIRTHNEEEEAASSPHFCSLAPSSSVNSSTHLTSFMLKEGFSNFQIGSKDKRMESVRKILIEDKENYHIQNRPDGIRSQRCSNHPAVKAQCSINYDGVNQLSYCQKCALHLAHQGFQVEFFQKPIRTKSDQKMIRTFELNQICSLFQTLKSDVVNKKRETNFSIVSSQTLFHDQIEEINEYFSGLHSYLDELKNKFYNTMLEEKQTSLKNHHEWSRMLESMTEELQNINEDIENNHEKITEINENQYQQLTESLEQHLDQYSHIRDCWKIDPIRPKPVYLPQIGNVIEALSEQFSSHPILTKHTSPRNSYKNTLQESLSFKSPNAFRTRQFNTQ